MGKINYGVNGPLTGKVGNVVGSSWRGISYVKSRPVRKKPPTEKEKINRHIFAITQLWINPLKDFLRAGFKNYSLTVRGIHAAKSYLYKHALIRDGYQSSVDPARMQISQGNLPLAEDIQLHFDQDKSAIRVTWNPQVSATAAGQEPASHDDQMMILAYNIEEGEAIGKVNGAFRRSGEERIEIPAGLNAVYHVYVAFLSADRTCQSNSVYLGYK